VRILRRSFLGGVAALAGGGLSTVLSHRAFGKVGALVSDPAGVLDLPSGFSYVRLQSAGATMSDGNPAGFLPDAMACFEDAEKNYVLMRNHEEDGGTNAHPDLAFAADALGGVSRLVIARGSLEVLSSNLVLTGTRRNCAGGTSPWGWLTCEESDADGHGWVFLCDPNASKVQPPRRIPSFGRFYHEAVAVDPKTSIAYLTEDKFDGALYRHVPHDPSDPFTGKLQALAIAGSDNFATGSGMNVGDQKDVRWVDIADPEAVSKSTRIQARDAGAAAFVRGEGNWFDRGAVFFTATAGGPTRQGQVFRLDIGEQSDILTLVAQEEGKGELTSPDNLTVAPWGDLLVCEDHKGPNQVWGITPDGAVYPFVRNAHDGGESEFAGVCFSPDGKVMFVNLQAPGWTFAITGPFPSSRGCAGCN
jgi:secreted PhoX family phosphatase